MATTDKEETFLVDVETCSLGILHHLLTLCWHATVRWHGDTFVRVHNDWLNWW